MKDIKEFENKIFCGDCLEIMKQIPDKCVDLVLTDPPYGIGYEYDLYNDSEENLIDLVNKFMPEALRIGKMVAVFTGVQNVWKYPKGDWIMAYVWNTTATYGKFGYNQWQPIVLWGQDIKGFGSVNEQLKSDVIKFSGGASVGFLREHKDKNHPCPKPENIVKKLVARLTNPGDIVLDPFNGSGTTCVAAKQLNRRYIGIDISEKYCEIARQRLKQDILL